MESIQPQLAALPLVVDIWPLIADDYSSCCLHVVNDGQILDISTLKIPLILSQGVHHRGPSHPSAQLRTLMSVECLLNILTFSTSETAKPISFRQLGFQGEWGYLQELRPQTYILVAQDEGQDSWFRRNLLGRLTLHHLPETFVVILRVNSGAASSSDTNKNNVTFRIKFLCWYCRAEAEKSYVRMPLDTFESSCSIHKYDCGNILTRMVEANVFDFAVNFWFASSEHNLQFVHPDVNIDPFTRTNVTGHAD